MMLIIVNCLPSQLSTFFLKYQHKHNKIKKLTIELQDKVEKIPSELDEYNLSISNDNYSLIYNYNLHAERTGITKMLQDLKNAGLRMRDLKTEQNNLEKIFVTLVKENNED